MTLNGVLGARNRVKVLRALYLADGLSGRRLAAQAGISPSANKAAVEELVNAGLVLRTDSRARSCYELNRSHHLFRVLERLFAEERRLPERLAETARRHLRTARPPQELLCVGVSESLQVFLAVFPGLQEDHPLGAALGKHLHFEFGFTFGFFCRNPEDIPRSERLWTLPRADQRRVAQELGDSERALRFFGIHRPRDETRETGNSGPGGR